jgi:hypothetical protein
VELLLLCMVTDCTAVLRNCHIMAESVLQQTTDIYKGLLLSHSGLLLGDLFSANFTLCPAGSQ